MSRARYVFRNGEFIERKTGEPLSAPDRIATPFVLSDVTYKSPLSGKEVTSRSQRREEMKAHGVRECDPSEFKPVYRSRKWAERMKGEHDTKAGQPDYGGEIARPQGLEPLPSQNWPARESQYKRLSKEELPSRIARTIAE